MKNVKSDLSILYSVNDHFFDLFVASLKSLIESNDIFMKHIYVVYLKLSSKNLIYLEKMKSLNPFIKLIKFDYPIIKEFVNKRYGVESLIRLFAPNIVDSKYTLYIDVDTIILEPIDQLLDVANSMSTPIAAISKTSSEIYFRYLESWGLPPECGVFNSGVLLINNFMIKETGLFQKVLDFVILNQNKLIMPDQDGLNLIIQGNYTRLPNNYNVTSDLFKIVTFPKIIHYTGPIKPNSFFYTGRFKYEYLRYGKYSTSFIIHLNSLIALIKKLIKKSLSILSRV